MNILAELRSRFQKALRGLTDDPQPYTAMVKPAQDPRFGDFQANCAMPLAKKQQQNPRDLAAEIVHRLDVANLCQEPEIAGPGFINLRLRDDWLRQQTAELAADERLGVEPVEQPRHYLIDYSAPNIAKPMHVGHLRSTVIGSALDGILRFLGHRVTSDNHIGDWGTQFGMVIYGYRHFLDQAAYEQNPVEELARFYRLVNQLATYHDVVAEIPGLQSRLEEKRSQLKAAEAQAETNDKKSRKALKGLHAELDALQKELQAAEAKRDAVEADPELKALAEAHPGIAQAARQETAKLHAGDEENLRLWKHFLPICLQALQQVYDRLGIRFDLTLGESFYQPMLADVVNSLRQQGLARESDRAVCVFLPGYEAPFIVQKADGAYTYATTDLATIQYRLEELDAEAILYVVDARQSDHFQMLFETARQWGYSDVELRHVSFGTILGEGRRPFKTRAGDTVGLESLLDEAVSRAREIVDANDEAKPDGPELDETTRAEVAEVVGIGGIKYADLKHNRQSDYVFSWQKMLATNGDTATYMQYAYARICGIFRKGGIDRETFRGENITVQFTTPEERALALQLNRFAEAVSDVVVEYRPNVLTHYLYQTAGTFTNFYNACPVLPEEDESIRQSRLLLCDLTARVIAKGLALLGIGTCEQM